MSDTVFATWAIVEVMGHTTYAGYVTTETIAGLAMLRVDVPAVKDIEPFTKFIAMAALYGISPCSEMTARYRAESLRATPFESWNVERQVRASLQASGLLLESTVPDDFPVPCPPQLPIDISGDDDDLPF